MNSTTKVMKGTCWACSRQGGGHLVCHLRPLNPSSMKLWHGLMVISDPSTLKQRQGLMVIVLIYTEGPLYLPCHSKKHCPGLSLSTLPYSEFPCSKSICGFVNVYTAYCLFLQNLCADVLCGDMQRCTWAHWQRHHWRHQPELSCCILPAAWLFSPDL